MEIVEHVVEERMRREQAADRLRELADQLSRNNGFSFVHEGMPVTVRVPDQVDLKIEVEVGSEGSEVEIELSW